MTELWAPADIKKNLNVGSRDTVNRWQQRPEFPTPKMTHGIVRFYDAAEIIAWHAGFKAGNPKKKIVLDLYRADPTRSMNSIGKEAECSPQSAKAWLIAMGELPAPAEAASETDSL